MSDQKLSRRALLAGAGAGAWLSTVRPNAQTSDPTTLTIEQAGKLIATRQLSPVELTRAYLARIDRLNPSINAYITVLPDAALAQARTLESEPAAGRRPGPPRRSPTRL